MKTRDMVSAHKIALLATGDEICQGDILNTNSQHIAQRLHDAGMQVGMHAVTTDHITEIESIIRYLLSSHQVLIITGGLGPTSDDLTRFALANYLGKPLHFDQPTWDSIVARLQKFGYHTPPESNRQQALFPEGSIIIPNQSGTAAGCQLEHDAQLIFMLPGPPTECLPMVDAIVLPVLQQKQFQHIAYRQSWLLFGVSEGQIAEQLDHLLAEFDCTTGYRIAYPYIEFKIYTDRADVFNTIIPLIESTISPYLISEGKLTASEALKQTLLETKQSIQLCDLATGGALELAIQSPETYNQVSFVSKLEPHPEKRTFLIEGLTDYWQGNDTKHTTLTLTFSFQHQEITRHTQAPNRGSRIKGYATEWIAYQIREFMPTL